MYQMGYGLCFTLFLWFKMIQEEKTAVIYARVSSQNDRQDTSRQITDLRKYAEANSLKIEKVFEEIGGKTGFARMP